MKGRPVNRRGYLIDEAVGCIINSNNLNLMFRREDLTDDGDIPMPYKFERFNFNPHEVLGHFDYDTSSTAPKPIILRNKQGQLVDKFLRPVNESGYLVDDLGNILDNQGRVLFIREQLSPEGELPLLYNYRGKKYDIKSVIGVFSKDPASKKILFCSDDKSAALDRLGRRVNPSGYLVDRMGNVVTQAEGRIVFFKSQLLFNEPPKLFPYTKFRLEWVQGNLNYDLFGCPVFSPAQVERAKRGGEADLFDLDGRRVNASGYLVDERGNVVDKRGYVVFKREVLDLDSDKRQTQVPKVFRLGVFERPLASPNVFENNLLSDVELAHAAQAEEAQAEQMQDGS